jgi:two-component system, NtrC family, sensor histidine kinase HydH
MLMPLLIALLASALAYARLVRSTPARVERRDWLAGAIRGLSRAGAAPSIAVALTYHVEHGLGASGVEWWRRDDDGSYRSRCGRIAASDAAVLDLWAAENRSWCRTEAATPPITHDPAGVLPDAARVLSAAGGHLVIALSERGRPVGVLVVGPCRDGGRYTERDVADLEALADHLVLVAEQAQMAASLEESQRMLQQATRLSTVGTLAAELAHEIRNPLVAVQTFLQILPERLDDPEVTVELRGVALTELQRVARLLNELLGMARASVATFAATDLEVVVEQVVRLLQVSARKKDVVLERVGERLPTSAADPSRLKQALVNLVLNAIQASPAGKTVTVTTRSVVDPTGHPQVELAIQDQGPGIPDHERESIFHPFFTTKENGTGLGLPVTRQIVTDHGGSIVVEGTHGRGASFVVRLPLTMAPRDASPDVQAA